MDDVVVAPGLLRSQLKLPLSDDDRVSLFERRTLGWLIYPAADLLGEEVDRRPKRPAVPDAGFAALQVLLAYFEMIGQYLSGQSSEAKKGTITSKAAFVAGFQDVFQGKGFQNSEVEDLYDRVRCGLYHTAQTKAGVSIMSGHPDVAWNKEGKIGLDPHKWVHLIRAHFAKYVQTIKQPCQLRTNFLKLAAMVGPQYA